MVTESSEKRYQFNLARQAYTRTSILAWLMCGAFLLCALLGTAGGFLLWPTYAHGFTLYLKWQDALVACCWCVGLVSLGGCILMLRFLYALREGYRQGMLILDGKNMLSGRDLSPKNFASVFWLVATTFSCFVVMLVGLVPAVLIGWTTHLPNIVLLVFATFIAFLLSLGGLILSVPFGAFFVIGLVGGVSFCRKLGALQTYTLSSQTTLRIDGLVLAIIHPDKPESLFDLQMLTPEDQRQALTLLRQRWLEAERPWNPEFGDEIEAALKEAEAQAVSLSL
jgi:MFS family permease